MTRRKKRFTGAAGSAERRFSIERRQNIRDDWHIWLALAIGVAGFMTWSFVANGVAARFLAVAAGALTGILFAMWVLGGHVSALPWWLGAEGERETAKQIEKLGREWHCEHDLVHEYGNWDHVLVGPPGVFLVDSKLLHGTAAAGGDALRSGRMTYPGASFRGGALHVKLALETQLGFRAPWVQAVAVVWGDFPQARHEEEDVVYLRGDQFLGWLASLPEKVNAPQRAAYVTALGEVRSVLSAASSR
jgi:membrane protein implicated in regulation of membrane protease activity